ncbi:MAG: thioredoxin family protein [Planctomycetales bacterium]
MNFAAKFAEGLAYAAFLERYADAGQRRRWDEFHAQVELSESQQALIAGFPRDVQALVLAGAWCGDCVNQCPIFERFAEQSPRLDIRYFDRDDHPDLAEALSICGGRRVPVVVFLSEDGHVCGWYGDRTLAKYRQIVRDQLGAACPTGFVAPGGTLLADVVLDWLDEFERIQLMLRTSGRLRQLHGD